MSDRIYIQKMIPPQLPFGVSEDELIKQAKSTQNCVLGISIVQLVLQIFLKGSLDRLWNLFFTMQIICYLVIYTVSLPANTSIYMVEFTKLIEFTVLNPDSLIQLAIGDPEFKLVNLMSGYIKTDGALSMADDLSFYLLVLLFGSILMVTLCVVYFTIIKARAKLKKLKDFLMKKFFCNGMIRSITIAYIKLCISFGAQVKEELNHKAEQTSRE